MKSLRMLGLAAVTAAALTAILGPGTASAARLCEKNFTSGCPETYGGFVGFTAEDSIKLAGPFGIVLDTCTESRLEGSITSEGGNEIQPVQITVTTLTFGSCTRRTTVGFGGTLSISHITSTDNGTVSSSGMTWTVHELPNIVGNPATCAYITTNTDIGTITGNLVFGPTLDISATVNSETANCPSGTWSGHYRYSGTTPFIVTTI